MKIKSIGAAGFKGRQFFHNLSDLNLITGANASGKTSRLDAIQLGLCGFHPNLARTNQGVFALSSDDKMEVNVELTAPSSAKQLGGMARWWTRDKKGAIKAEASPSCSYPELQFPAVLIDAESYFALSDRERVRYVFGLVKIPGADDTCEQLVAALHEARIDGVPALVAEAVNAIAKQMSATWNLFEGEPQSYLDGLLTHLKASQSSVAASIKNMTGTVRGLTELSQEPPRDVTKELAAARTQLEQLLKEQTQLEQEIGQAAKLAKQRADLAADMGAIVLPDAALVNELTAQIAELEKCLLAAPKSEVGAKAVEKLRGILKQRREALIKANTEKVNAYVAAQGQEGKKEERERIKQDIAALQQDTLGLVELEVQYQREMAAGSEWEKRSRLSPTDFETLATAAAQMREVLKLHEFTKKRATQLQTLADALECIALASQKPSPKCTIDLRQLVEKQNAQVALERSQARLATLGSDSDLDAANAALASKKAQYEAADTAAKEAEAQVTAAEASDKAVRDWTALLERKRAELARLMEAPKKREQLQKQLEGLGVVVPLEDEDWADARWTASCDGIKDKRLVVFALEGAEKLWLKFKAEAATTQEATKRRGKLEAELSATKAAVSLVETKQGEMVATAFKEILEVANKVVKDILKSELCYRDGEIGMMQGTQFVSHKTFSGTEAALAYAAMSVSLAVQSPLKLVLIDELGRLDASNKLRLVARLRELLNQGVIDQCVLVDTSSVGYDLNAVTHIAL